MNPRRAICVHQQPAPDLIRGASIYICVKCFLAF
jgi:hypothetical protein